MAHLISEVSGQAECFVAGQPAWHGLGKRVPANVTSAEAIELAGLDWKVEQRPVAFRAEDGSYNPAEQFVANVRKDAAGKDVFLGIVNPSYYKIVQNTDAFAFFDVVVGEQLAIYHTAGALKNGKRVWMLAQLPQDLIVGNKDAVNKYLLLANGHDGKFMLRMFFTPVRVVCNNTLTLAVSQKEKEGSKKTGEQEGIFISHTGDLEGKVEEAVKALKIANKQYEELEALYNQLQKCTVSDDEVAQYHKAVLPDVLDTDNRAKGKSRDAMMKNYRHGLGADLSFGTMWGAYNSVTEYFDHSRYANRKIAPESRMESVIFGGGRQVKKNALALACEALK